VHECALSRAEDVDEGETSLVWVPGSERRSRDRVAVRSVGNASTRYIGAAGAAAPNPSLAIGTVLGEMRAVGADWLELVGRDVYVVDRTGAGDAGTPDSGDAGAGDAASGDAASDGNDGAPGSEPIEAGDAPAPEPSSPSSGGSAAPGTSASGEPPPATGSAGGCASSPLTDGRSAGFQVVALAAALVGALSRRRRRG
jgi:hypothetical protein